MTCPRRPPEVKRKTDDDPEEEDEHDECRLIFCFLLFLLARLNSLSESVASREAGISISPSRDPDVLETSDAIDVWGKDLVKLKGNQEAMLEGLRDYMWNIKGQVDISDEVKEYFDENGYDFSDGNDEDDDEDWGDDDW